MKTLEEKILEILNNCMDCDGRYITGKPASVIEIASIMKDFIKWFIDQYKFYYNPKLKKFFDQTLITSLPEVTIDDIFDYWLNNIKK